MSCIGTAGHVDHGKSTLVQALTGIDPDRLTEEKERGMTIDLGFAWLRLSTGQEVSLVDVPGHESFIKNMLAGVGGIDAALLVIAADEGVMPQTREHLAILDLLRVERGVVALTKADLVDDEWLALVREEVAETLQATTLSQAAIIPVSAYTGQGLPQLRSELERILQDDLVCKNIARPRLSIDRVFSLSGFGTIVTGTLLDGILKVGQEVEILPHEKRTRLRTLQTHKQQIEQAQPGSRVACNLVNIARSELQRGDVIALPGQLQPTILLDARLALLPTARPLAHNTQVDFFCGAQEISARMRVLEGEEIQPGAEGWVQLRLQRPAVVARRDRFILRIPSPGSTIGGGEIIDVHPRYHRRGQSAVIESLERLRQGTPEEIVLAALDRRPVGRTMLSKPVVGSRASTGLMGYELAELVKECHLAEDVTQQTLESLIIERRVHKIGNFWFAQPVWELLVADAIRLVKEQHQQYPLRNGLSKEEWRSRLHLSPRMAADVLGALQADSLLETVEPSEGEGRGRAGAWLRLPAFRPTFTDQQESQVAQLLQQFLVEGQGENSYMPPTRAEAEVLVGSEVINALLEQGRLIKIGEGLLLGSDWYKQALKKLIEYMRMHETLTVAEARTLLGTTRKYCIPLLEHMDALRLTRRNGDERTLGVIEGGVGDFL
ncbi:selenocysteine-specific translation elongation factor [Tengunoibacter tsumagoiensis]|uniref:Selenocysteine-specific elongation factor n=1 Tax=Tengunoibacter tsumagoiensis TaxID=2014871 RepID=A0A401ZTU0_9CHLR|nr:selenocysteine-specific translation elongation factor [Tengunoibacter tsumagoiensis]GCE10190.1 selenocysteine-specific translation factor [Tengunoibacter tsumagoiensis]